MSGTGILFRKGWCIFIMIKAHINKTRSNKKVVKVRLILLLKKDIKEFNLLYKWQFNTLN